MSNLAIQADSLFLERDSSGEALFPCGRFLGSAVVGEREAAGADERLLDLLSKLPSLPPALRLVLLYVLLVSVGLFVLIGDSVLCRCLLCSTKMLPWCLCVVFSVAAVLWCVPTCLHSWGFSKEFGFSGVQPLGV